MQSLLARWLVLPALILGLALSTASAQLSIEITGGGAKRIPIALVPMPGEAALPGGLSGIVRADLERSGLFRGLELPPFVPAPTEATNVDFAEWRNRLADVLVLGSVTPRPDGRFEARFLLYDIVKQRNLSGMSFTFGREQARTTAHRIADFIYEKVTGERGVFSTRIAYVVKRGAAYELQIADSDGYVRDRVNGPAGEKEYLLRSTEPIISPVWSPDGTKMAYVSFEAKKPIVYIQDVSNGRRHVVANFKGSNSAPAWSPDGKRLAVSLSREGGSQIYLINPDGSGLRRLTSSSAIDTEPRFSPDGQWIYFTSDRGGSPQIYRMPAEGGGEAQRVTFDGNYNVSPRIAPDGKSLAYVTRTGGKFQAALLDFASRQVQILTDSDRDESPSFAPNGRMILLATVVKGQGVLSTVSADGRKLWQGAVGGDVREPTWGPYVQ